MTQPITGGGNLHDVWQVGAGRTHELPVTSTDWRGDGGEPTDPSHGGMVRPRNRPIRRRFRSYLLELLLAAAICAGVAAAMGWQVLKDLSRVVPGVGVDPYIELWSLGWSGHALKPGSGIPFTQVFNGNAFYPADYSLAFTDSLFGLGPFTWFFHGAGGLVTAYNLIFVFGPALAAFGGYALARQVGAHPLGAAVAGAGIAYAPWHTGQFSHLHVLTTGPMVLALAMLARGHGLTMSGDRPPVRPLWVLLGWLVAAWQLTIGFAHGLPFAYLLAVIGLLVVVVVPLRWHRARRRQAAALSDPNAAVVPGAAHRPRRTAALVITDLLGGGIFAVVGALMAYPYLRVEAIDPAAVADARSLEQVLKYSPKAIDLITPPGVEGTWSWLTRGEILFDGSNEVRLLPGAILLLLAVIGLFVSTWRWWWRVTLAVTTALIIVFCMGARFPDRLFPGPDAPFVLLWKHVPGWAADRTPGRLIVFAILALALLAAGAVSRMCGWGVVGRRGGSLGLRTVVFSVLPVLIVLEGWAKIPVNPVPPPPQALTGAVAPLVVLPSVWTNDSKVMFWLAARGYPEVANGQSGFTPSTLTRMRAELTGFPDVKSVNYLRQNGFRSVVVLRTPVGTPLWQDADRVPDPSLGLTRTDLGESLLYTLTPAPPG
jgi:hypothetical protein